MVRADKACGGELRSRTKTSKASSAVHVPAPATLPGGWERARGWDVRTGGAALRFSPRNAGLALSVEPLLEPLACGTGQFSDPRPEQLRRARAAPSHAMDLAGTEGLEGFVADQQRRVVAELVLAGRYVPGTYLMGVPVLRSGGSKQRQAHVVHGFLSTGSRLRPSG